MAVKKTRYAVVKFPKKITTVMDVNIYGKKTSNKEIMIKYYEEISAKHPHSNVKLLTEEQAKAFKDAVRKHFRDIEDAKLKRLDERMAKLNACYTFYDNFSR